MRDDALQSLVLGCGIGGVLVAIVFLLSEVARRRELTRAVAAFRMSIRGAVPAPPLRFRSDQLATLWRLFHSLNLSRQSDRIESESIHTVMAAGTTIASRGDDSREMARAIGQLLLERCAPQIRAVAVLARPDIAVPGEALFSHGAPPARLESVVLAQFDEHCAEGGEPFGYRLAPTGSLFDLSAFDIQQTLSLPLRRDGQIIGMIWLGLASRSGALPPERAADIRSISEYCAACFETAHRVALRLREREEQRNILLGLSHDLRAPGNSALYSLRDLLSGTVGELTPDQRLRLRIVEECIEDQLDMIEDLLEYSRCRRGPVPLEAEDIELDDLVPRILTSFTEQARAKGLSLLFEPSPAVVRFDRRQLRRILENLLSNALKFTASGAIAIEVSSLESEVAVSVADTGRGVSESERALLFQEYSRIGAADLHGFGLGLVVARSLAEANSATLSYDPMPGGGSRFTLRVPRRESNTRGAFPKRILVLDDDPAVCRMNERYLEAHDTEVFSARTTDEAFDAIARYSPDFIVTDLYLDGSRSGVLESLRARSPAPTLVLSGSSEIDAETYASTVSGLRVLRKPAGRSALREAVQALYEQSLRS